MRLPLSRSIPSQDGDDGSWAVGGPPAPLLALRSLSRSSISLARSRAFGCRGFTSVCRSSASVLSPATTRHVCPVCFASHSDARLRPSSTLHSHTRSSVSLTRSRSFGCRSLTLGRSLTSVRSTASVSRNDTCLLQHPFAALPLLCRASPGIGDLYLCPLLREERVAR